MPTRNVSMQFGRNGGAVHNVPGMKLITQDEVTDASTVTLEFEPNATYLLFTKEWTQSSGAYYGHHIHVIATPLESLFGSAAVAHGTAYASTNNGCTFTWSNDSTVTVTQASTARNFSYALYRVY